MERGREASWHAFQCEALERGRKGAAEIETKFRELIRVFFVHRYSKMGQTSAEFISCEGFGKNMANILIVDDDRQLSKALSRFVEKRTGHRATSCHLLEEGLETARRKSFDAIFLDVSLPDGDGLEALGKFKSTASAPEVIVMTGFASRCGAETAIRSDAWDYVKKPFEIEEALSVLEQALQYRNDKQRAAAVQDLALDRIAGSSPGMLQAHDKLRQCAAWDGNVLLTGETGTGKELFARAIHANKPQGGQAVRRRRLHGPSGEPRRKLAVRLRERLFHRRGHSQGGACQKSQGRNAFSG